MNHFDVGGNNGLQMNDGVHTKYLWKATEDTPQAVRRLKQGSALTRYYSVHLLQRSLEHFTCIARPRLSLLDDAHVSPVQYLPAKFTLCTYSNMNAYD